MAVAACGDDDFGKLFADVHLRDTHSLRGFGSLHWTFEDEADVRTRSGNTLPVASSGDILPVANLHDCFAKVASAEADLDSFAAQCTSDRGNVNIDSNGDIAVDVVESHNVESDSEDDLRIVLNPCQKTENEGSADDSEDGEDFVVLTGNEPAVGKGWPENSHISSQDDTQAKIAGEERAGLSKDEQVAGQKASGMRPRICYGGQAFRRRYRYIRATGTGKVHPVSLWRSKFASYRGRFAKSGSFRGHGGYTNFHFVSGGASPVQAFSSRPEYILPPDKTVFDVDIDAFKKKPWRLPNVDLTDYFNFELNEITWKDYCKRLGQFCVEVTTKSKISVYESGRGQLGTDCTQLGIGQHVSSSIQGQQPRDCDAIFLIDVKERVSCQKGTGVHQAGVGDASQVLNSGGANLRLTSEKKICVPETEQPTLKQRTHTSQRRSCFGPKDASANELGETENVAVVSRLKTPSPATPPERLPSRSKKYMAEYGINQSSSLDLSPQAGHNSSALHEVVQRVEISSRNTSDGGLKLRAAMSAARHIALKRRSNCAPVSHIMKKQKLDSNQANHGCRFSSLFIKKLSRVHTQKAISAAQGKVEILRQEKDVGPVFPSGAIRSTNFLDSCTDERRTEIAENKETSINCAKLKRKGGHKLKESKDDLGKAPEKCVEAKLSKKARVKSNEKGLQGKKRTKSKDKVHLPGCPNFKKRLEKSAVLQDMGNVSIINFVSKDKTFYWKTVGPLCREDTNDSAAENLGVIYNCHKNNNGDEVSRLFTNRARHHINPGEKRVCSKKKIKRTGEKGLQSMDEEPAAGNQPVEYNTLGPSNASHLLFGTKKCAKCISRKDEQSVSRRSRIDSSLTHGINSNRSKQVPVEDQGNSSARTELFQDKERDSVGEQLCSVSDCKILSWAGSSQSSGLRLKKRCKKSSHKPACQNPTFSNCLIGPEKANDMDSSVREKNLGSKMGALDKTKTESLQFCRTPIFSTEVESENRANRTISSKNRANRTISSKNTHNFENQGRRTKWHCQETKSFWAFSI